MLGVMTEQPDVVLDLAGQYHTALPARIRAYLNQRGISDPVIDLHLLGWNDTRITVPVFDRDGQLAFFKLAKDPEDEGPGPKMMTSPGGYAELYGWERVRVKPCRIVVCEGEFDRLILESQGFAAVTSTGGAGVFRTEWAEAFAEIPEVYNCFDWDDAGRRGALRVARMIPQAKLVELPEEVGPGGDVTDFFVRLGRSREEFEKLLETAQTPPPEKMPEPVVALAPGRQRAPSAEVARIKDRVPIAEFVGRYVLLRRSGRAFVGLCPFHEDHRPSFTVYSEKGNFHCYGCGEHGDVIAFLMKFRRLTFPEAVQILQRLAQ